MESTNKLWKLYESGKSYNNKLKIDGYNFYELIDLLIDFYNGNQWRNSEDIDLPKPVFNVIKRVLSFLIANLMSDNVKVMYEPLENNAFATEIEINASEFVTSEVNNLFEKFSFNNRLRDVITDGAITADGCMHFIFDPTKKPYRGKLGQVKGEICMEIVDGANVMFGNANSNIVEKQPYIVVIGRDLARSLNKEAKRFNKSADEIKSDQDNKYQSGYAGKIEVEADEYGKALYIIVYERDLETGKIKVSKATKDVIIYENIDTGLDYYPISWFNWEKQKNQYHGRSPQMGMLPNQIAINKLFGQMICHSQQSAFPNRIYDADKIPYLTNQIGEDIAVTGLQNGERVENFIQNLRPAEMSGQIAKIIEMLFSYTKEMLGMTDASMGNINNPENTSAIVTVQKSATIPLENVKSNVNEFVEDVARILVDMMATYYGTRPILVDGVEGKQLIEFDFSQLKDIYLSQKIEVGNTTVYSEPAQVQTLTNLLQTKDIDLKFFLERIPDNIIPKRKEAIAELEKVQVENDKQQMEYETIAQFVETLPQEYQQQFNEVMAQMQEKQVA